VSRSKRKNRIIGRTPHSPGRSPSLQSVRPTSVFCARISGGFHSHGLARESSTTGAAMSGLASGEGAGASASDSAAAMCSSSSDYHEPESTMNRFLAERSCSLEHTLFRDAFYISLVFQCVRRLGGTERARSWGLRGSHQGSDARSMMNGNVVLKVARSRVSAVTSSQPSRSASAT
jgi:hypothetical protein